jgi:hypothetical protein
MNDDRQKAGGKYQMKRRKEPPRQIESSKEVLVGEEIFKKLKHKTTSFESDQAYLITLDAMRKNSS